MEDQGDESDREEGPTVILPADFVDPPPDCPFSIAST